MFCTILALLFGFTVAADCALNIFVHFYTNKTRFIDNKQSKFLHMRNFHPEDAVFIGSSFTKNHISTNFFQTKGWSTYNLGISGRLLADFPSMAAEAMKAKPKFIVFNISVDEIFSPPKSDYVYLQDLLAYFQSEQSSSFLLKSLYQYLLGLHTLNQYREAIYERIAGFLPKIDRILGHESASAKANDQEYSPAQLASYQEQLQKAPDCDTFKKAVYSRMTVVTCTNGDGLQYGLVDFAKSHRSHPTPLEKPNKNSIRLLNKVLSMASATSKPLVVLTPVWEENYQYNLQELQSQIQAPVIDLTQTIFTDEEWCDAGHFNYYGRLKYSEVLWENLQKIRNVN